MDIWSYISKNRFKNVRSENKLVIRHVDQLLKTKCKIPENNDDWYNTINTENATNQLFEGILSEYENLLIGMEFK